MSQQEPYIIMHAARDVPAGEAVTINYCGPQLLEPVGARRMHLQVKGG